VAIGTLLSGAPCILRSIAFFLQRLASCETIDSPHKRSWSAISWTKLDEEAYYRLIGELREALPVGAPFWIIEEHWEPSETGDDAL
jgi:hypothetical protein